MISAMARGEPSWLRSVGHGAAALLAGQGLLASALLAAGLAVVAVGVYLPRSAARATLLLAVLLAAATWVVGQALGGILTGMGTDPGTGPLLMLLAVAYWPAAATPHSAADSQHSPPGRQHSPPDSPHNPPDEKRRRGMTGPSWLADGFAGLMLLTAVYCAGRLAAARIQRRPTERDVDLVHALMGVAMAGLLTPRHGSPACAQPGFPCGPATVGRGVRRGHRLVRVAGWTGLRGWPAVPVPSARHRLPHLIMSGAMVNILPPWPATWPVSAPGRRDGRHRGPLPAAGASSWPSSWPPTRCGPPTGWPSSSPCGTGGPSSARPPSRPRSRRPGRVRRPGCPRRGPGYPGPGRRRGRSRPDAALPVPPGGLPGDCPGQPRPPLLSSRAGRRDRLSQLALARYRSLDRRCDRPPGRLLSTVRIGPAHAGHC